MAAEPPVSPPRRPAHARTPTAPRPQWRSDGVDELCDAILTLRDRDEAAAFLRDACSLHELEAIAHRWQAARLLDRGVPYARVAAEVGASTATVTRVAHWLRHGEGGYRLVLDRMASG